MDAITPTKPILPGKPLRCPSPIEVDSTDLEIPAATVKAWIAHLRSGASARARPAQTRDLLPGAQRAEARGREDERARVGEDVLHRPRDVRLRVAPVQVVLRQLHEAPRAQELAPALAVEEALNHAPDEISGGVDRGRQAHAGAYLLPGRALRLWSASRRSRPVAHRARRWAPNPVNAGTMSEKTPAGFFFIGAPFETGRDTGVRGRGRARCR